MTPEHELLPYHCCELPPGPWLVFAPHADDETFGMAGALALAADQKLETHVVILTDGALGGDDGDGALVEIRKQEVAAACNLLNVTTLQTWPLADRGLHHCLHADQGLPKESSHADKRPQVEARAHANDSIERHDGIEPRDSVERIAAAIADINPGTVFFPGVLELHPDHRAAAVLVWRAMQRLQQRAWRQLLPQLWSYDISMQSPANRLLDITAKVAIKKQAMAVYASQNSQNNYPDVINSLNRARTYTLPPEVSHAEAFYCYAPAQLRGTLRQAALHALAGYWAD